MALAKPVCLFPFDSARTVNKRVWRTVRSNSLNLRIANTHLWNWNVLKGKKSSLYWLLTALHNGAIMWVRGQNGDTSTPFSTLCCISFLFHIDFSYINMRGPKPACLRLNCNLTDSLLCKGEGKGGRRAELERAGFSAQSLLGLCVVCQQQQQEWAVRAAVMSGESEEVEHQGPARSLFFSNSSAEQHDKERGERRERWKQTGQNGQKPCHINAHRE